MSWHIFLSICIAIGSISRFAKCLRHRHCRQGICGTVCGGRLALTQLCKRRHCKSAVMALGAIAKKARVKPESGCTMLRGAAAHCAACVCGEVLESWLPEVEWDVGWGWYLCLERGGLLCKVACKGWAASGGVLVSCNATYLNALWH